MDFYSRQAAARRQTRWLVLAFAAAVLAVALALDAVLFTLLDSTAAGYPVVAPLDFAARNPATALTCTLLVLAVLGLASWYKSLQLRGGGGVVARALGGVRIERDTADFRRKRLHNVVEEMAIASGVPMPEVYVLEEEAAINAFAAGHTPANAAVVITRGALERLGRDELQGVIAHEFSHILNGDMRLNVQLMGWLFGLFVIALAGRTILRVGPRARRGSSTLVLVAFAVMVLGYVGLFAGRILQAAVSRQRERLADASAVQFTRNPQGLKEALVKIAGLSAGSRLAAIDVEQVAHMLFAQGLARLFATHPPLLERIRTLDPHFDARDLPRLAAQALQADTSLEEPQALPALVSETIVADPRQIAGQVGQIDTPHIRHAAALRSALPESLRALTESSGQARAAVLGLLLARAEPLRDSQLLLLRSALEPPELAAVRAAASLARELPPMLRLPALLQAFPALRTLPKAERERLAQLAGELIMIDSRIEVFEFCLAKLLALLLRDELEARAPHGRVSIAAAERELHVLFATLARMGAPDERRARMAYEAGMHTVLPMTRPAYAVLHDWPRRMDDALPVLEKLHPFAKKMVIEGLVRTVSHDEALTVAEAELLRTVCALLHCPLPALLPLIR